MTRKLSVERQLAILLENQLLLTKIVKELADGRMGQEEEEKHEQRPFPKLGYIG